MSKEDRTRADARFTKAAKSGKSEQEIAAKAVLDNMARLKALRLAREAAEPPPPATTKKPPAKSSSKPGAKAPALSEWLAGQQNGGRRT